MVANSSLVAASFVDANSVFFIVLKCHFSQFSHGSWSLHVHCTHSVPLFSVLQGFYSYLFCHELAINIWVPLWLECKCRFLQSFYVLSRLLNYIPVCMLLLRYLIQFTFSDFVH
jgi:hypothetical protein